MKYTVQLSTGGRYRQEYTAPQIISRLKEVLSIFPVEKVLLGWYPDSRLYTELKGFLAPRHIDMVLWLPVFSDTAEFGPVDAAVDLWGNTINPQLIQSGQTFDFCCPSSQNNIDLIKSMYDKYFADCGFDGVFLDRIRTHSFGGGVSGVLSCGCDRCKAAYREFGVDLDHVKMEYRKAGHHFFDRSPFGIWENSVARAFFDAKAHLIAAGVGQLTGHFGAMGLQVGLDLFAPLLSPYVGQDYQLLSQGVHFVKPMMYRQTLAPAGMAYEYDLLRRQAPSAKGGPALDMGPDFLAGQLQPLSQLPCHVYPGIEINYHPELVPTSPQYVKDSVDTIRAHGFSGVALSWNIMQAPISHLEVLAP